MRVDPAPGFQSLFKSQPLKTYGITIELGRIKNLNQNPVAEKAVQEFEDELLRLDPSGGSVSEAQLTVALSSLNSRIRLHGLSASEVFIRRNQYTAEELNNDEKGIISAQHANRTDNHAPSHKSQLPASSSHCHTYSQSPSPLEGSIVYFKNDRSKLSARPMYMVTRKDGDQLQLRKFVNNQLRSREYSAHASEVFCISMDIALTPSNRSPDFSQEDTCNPMSQMHPIPDELITVTTPQQPPVLPIMDIPLHDPTPEPTEPADVDPVVPEPNSGETSDTESENSSADIDTISPPAQPASPPGPRRSQRTKFPSTRLKGYVWHLIGQWQPVEEDGEEEDTTPRCL